VINYINSHPGDTSLHDPQEVLHARGYVDANADEQITAADVLFLINYINSHPIGSGEGEKLTTDPGGLASPAAIHATCAPGAAENVPTNAPLAGLGIGRGPSAGCTPDVAGTDAALASWGDVSRDQDLGASRSLTRPLFRTSSAHGQVDPAAVTEVRRDALDVCLAEWDCTVPDGLPEIDWL